MKNSKNDNSKGINRRKFIGSAIAASVVLPQFISEEVYANELSSATEISEPKRKTPVIDDVDGLMMAGRCISGDFVAHSSYRVTGNAVAMGEASGVVAALAAQSNRLPNEVPWAEGKTMLVHMGQYK